MSEAARFTVAFTAELAAAPDVPPGPKALATRMGLKNTRNLPGRLVRQRTAMLERAGFVRDDDRNKWVKQ